MSFHTIDYQDRLGTNVGKFKTRIFTQSQPDFVDVEKTTMGSSNDIIIASVTDITDEKSSEVHRRPRRNYSSETLEVTPRNEYQTAMELTQLLDSLILVMAEVRKRLVARQFPFKNDHITRQARNKPIETSNAKTLILAGETRGHARSNHRRHAADAQCAHSLPVLLHESPDRSDNDAVWDDHDGDGNQPLLAVQVSLVTRLGGAARRRLGGAGCCATATALRRSAR
jgi:hypothetical protein